MARARDLEAQPRLPGEGAGIELAAPAMREGGLGDVALEEMRAERSFLREEHVARKGTQCQARPREQARFPHVRAHDDRHTRRARRRDSLERAQQSTHLGDADVGHPAVRVFPDRLEIHAFHQALVEDDARLERPRHFAHALEVAQG